MVEKIYTKFFTVCYSDTPATSSQGQGHQTLYKMLNLEQGYNHAKVERPPLHRVLQKASNEVLVKSEKHVTRVCLCPL